MSVDVTEEDLNIFKQPLSTPQDLQEHISFMLADGKERPKLANGI